MADLSTLIDNSDIAAGKPRDAEPIANNFTAIVNAFTNGVACDVTINGAVTNTGANVVTGSQAVDNIKIDGNTISSTDTNGDINLTPNGSGKIASANKAQFAGINSTPIGADTASTGAFTSVDIDGSGAIKWKAFSSSIDGATGTFDCTISGTVIGCLPAVFIDSFYTATFYRLNSTTIRYNWSDNSSGTRPATTIYGFVFYT